MFRHCYVNASAPENVEYLTTPEQSINISIVVSSKAAESPSYRTHIAVYKMFFRLVTSFSAILHCLANFEPDQKFGAEQIKEKNKNLANKTLEIPALGASIRSWRFV